MKVGSVASIIGWALCILSLTMIMPIFVALAYSEFYSAKAFVLSAAITGFASGLLIISSRSDKQKASTKRENIVSAVVFWLVVPIFAALPLLFTGSTEGILNSYFESVSGLTTTGATVISSLETVDHASLFWRAILQWLGGISVVVLVVIHLAHLGVGGMQLYPSSLLHGEQDPLLDRLKDTGVVVVSIYAILALVCCILLIFSGLSPFDSITHALTAVSTGGFSTHNNSVSAFNNFTAEIILIVFMILGATNISLLWLVLRRQEFDVIKKDPELTKFIVVILIISAIIGISLMALSEIDKLTAFRVGLFSTVSAITTTGFYSGQNISWPLFVPMLLLVLMFSGGCTGSATGGLKTMRVMLLFRLAQREILRLAHPHGVEGIRYSGLSVDKEAMRAIWAFFVVLILAFGFVTISLALTGMDFRDSVFSAAGALSNTVPATVYLQDSFVSYEGVAIGTKIILCIGMIIGRLEFLTALIIFNPLFWRQ